MNPSPRDLGPLAWVMDELRRTLTDTIDAVAQFVADSAESRHSDLAEVDGAELRGVRQQLHQAGGALDMVELSAAARTLRALEAAVQRLMQKPALATPEFSQAVVSGAHTLTEYLDRILAGRQVHELALFPTYRDWQQLAGASRAHPADLWMQAHAEVELPAGKIYEPGGAVRAHLDRLVLHVVKTLNPQAALPLAQLSGGLARHAKDPAIRRFWAAAAGCFEAVATGKRVGDLYVKRAASSVLLQYSQLQHGDVQSLQSHTHDLLFLASQVRPDPQDPAQTHLRALWLAHGWDQTQAWDPEARLLGAYDPASLLALKATLLAVQQSWAVFTEAESVHPSSIENALVPLIQGFKEFMPSRTAWGHMSGTWSEVVKVCHEQGGIPQGLALEASNCLLLLGAELDDFDSLDPDFEARLQTLEFRLRQVIGEQPVPEPEAWMTERYRRVGQQATLVQVVTQWQSELLAVEETLDSFFRGSATVPAQAAETIHRRLEAMSGIAMLLDLPQARRAIESVLNMLQPLDSAAADRMALQAAGHKLGANVTTLGWMLDTFARQPDWARNQFVFDEQAGYLVSVSPEPVRPDQQAALVDEMSALAASEGVEATLPVPVELPQEPVVMNEDEEDLLSIFLDEARSVFEGADTTLGILRQQPDRLSELTALRRGFHTLKGSARMVGLAGVGEAAWAMEQLLNAWLADQKHAAAPLLDLSQQALAYLQQWVAELQSGQPSPNLRSAASIRFSADALRLEGRYQPIQSMPAGLQEPEPPILDEVVDLPDDLPEVPVLEEAVKLIGPLKVGLELYNVFINEADEWSRRLSQGLSEWRLVMDEPLPEDLSVWAHSLAGGAATVGYQGLSKLARSLEHALDRAIAAHPLARVSEAQADRWVSASDQIRELLHHFAAGFLREPQPDSIAALDSMEFRPIEVTSQPQVPELPESIQTDAVVAASERLDVDLLSVFLDEAYELLPKLSAATRQWLAWPENTTARAEILRNLHTLKGSSRLAGLLSLGDQTHHLESAILALPDVPVTSAIVGLQSKLDVIVTALDALRRSMEHPEPQEAQFSQPATSLLPETSPGLIPTINRLLPPELAAPSTGTVRVRAQLLDQLMSQTGDLLIARTRLENDVRALRQSFKDMSSNMDRMRAQLRDLELQTESQMQSRIAQSREADPRFDPLEFDRYTRVQELTRLLAESVNDVATVQQTLNRSVESVEGNLATQTHLTRELQRDLLRTRLVAFDTIQERLQRLVRQSAESAGKQAELTIDQQEVEVDRAVLEKLTPALEHLLRNAVVHGIEPPAERRHRGKPESGQIRIALSVQANDLSITLSDDGAGLDVERIRRRAIELELHPAGTPFSDDDAARLIFASGMSTASEVTEVAGRGIGLDVVRTEVMDLGGRIESHHAHEAGGTVFKLVVPLSTAVTQVVMLRVGHLVFGVPSPWVEQVRRVRAPELTVAYQTGQWITDSNEMPFYWAGGLLSQSPESTDTQGVDTKYWSVIEFLVAGQRLACHVDEVLGHQEIVVKAMGPQLSQLPGLTGATVLASGAVALIYNPVTLASVYGPSARAWKSHSGDTLSAQPERHASADAGLIAQAPLILVVDDSITVRRVTQRLLKREGYRVSLAADGMQALDLIAQELPLVVLCDIEMPRMDGFELVQHLRNEAQTQSIPVVMITSRLAEKHWDHARSLGVDHYLGKPYVEEELLAIIEGHVRLATHRA